MANASARDLADPKPEPTPPPPSPPAPRTPTHAERMCAIVDALAELRRDVAADSPDPRADWRVVVSAGVQHEQAGAADPHAVAGLIAMIG